MQFSQMHFALLQKKEKKQEKKLNFMKKKSKNYNKKKNNFFLNFYKENILVGTHLGCNSSKSKLKKGWHLSMVPFLVGTRNLNSILTLEESLHFLVKAFYVLTLVLKSGGNLLIVNNNPEFSNILKQTQKRISSSQIAYSDGKWVGGLLTNWKKFKPSALKFINFKYHFDFFLNKENIDLPSYKKWQACFEGLFCKKKKAITSKKLNNSIEKHNYGCLSLKHQKVSFLDELVFSKLPTFIFALSPNENQNMLEEAFLLHIPVIAITDSNTDLSLITYPIPANNQSIFFTRLCLNWISRIAQKTRKTKQE